MRPGISLRGLLCVLFVLSAACPVTSCAADTDNSAPADTARAPLPVPPAERLAEVFPGFKLTRELAEPFPCLAIYGPADSLLGFVADSDEAGTTAEGYTGPVPVRAYLNPAGLVLDFEVLRNRETPGYLAMALGCDFRDRMKAYRPLQDEPVDAVSFATITSAAIIRGLTGVVDRLSGELISPPPGPGKK